MSSISSWVLLLGIIGLLFSAGCATTSEQESSTPWNVPQSWENTIPLPGF